MASYNINFSKKFGITWYNDSSIYCGEIESERREGLGIEWVPGLYIYYGNYHQNYRSGYGVIKYNNEEVYAGMWAKDHYHGFGKIFSREGYVLECGTYRNSELKTKGDFR